jgi:uncharacterized circularly permuted ATP-grasp superfamily protein
VALTKGSLVVNSSQGGGSKDTWIIDTLPWDEQPTVAQTQTPTQTQTQSQNAVGG